jgi:2-C-methyl-D-erythritol 4-phosphate cytidylyltransferase
MTVARVAAVVAAAGRGERLGGEAPKAFRPIGGLPMVAHAVAALASASVDLVVVAVPPTHVSRAEAMLVGHHEGASLRVVEGGPSRHESVAEALGVLPGSVDVVLVHDAARPLVPRTLIDAVVAAVRSGAAAVVPAVPVVDTVRRVTAGVADGIVDRSTLRAMQTPQGFSRRGLDQAYAAAADLGAVTDDAALVEAIGITVKVVDGSPEAFKVTTSVDLVLAEALLQLRGAAQ